MSNDKPQPAVASTVKAPSVKFIAEGNTAAEVMRDLVAQGATLTDLGVGLMACVLHDRTQKIEHTKVPPEDSKAKLPYAIWKLNDGGNATERWLGAGLTFEQASLLPVEGGVPSVLGVEIAMRQIDNPATITAKFIARQAATATKHATNAAVLSDEALIAEYNARQARKALEGK